MASPEPTNLSAKELSNGKKLSYRHIQLLLSKYDKAKICKNPKGLRLRGGEAADMIIPARYEQTSPNNFTLILNIPPLWQGVNESLTPLDQEEYYASIPDLKNKPLDRDGGSSRKNANYCSPSLQDLVSLLSKGEERTLQVVPAESHYARLVENQTNGAFLLENEKEQVRAQVLKLDAVEAQCKPSEGATLTAAPLTQQPNSCPCICHTQGEVEDFYLADLLKTVDTRTEAYDFLESVAEQKISNQFVNVESAPALPHQTSACPYCSANENVSPVNAIKETLNLAETRDVQIIDQVKEWQRARRLELSQIIRQ